MRHQKRKVTLSRAAPARNALLTHLAESLILYEKIRTTKAKAKAVRSVVERMITKSKKNTLAARRDLIALLDTQNAAKKLMEELGPRYKDRAGGYTRMTMLENRKGDGAEEAIIEFV
ncbi:MAG: 50S ribosomal protein L17 [Candidatus Magasanikbacteria bacterium RIFCSPHIGHO2_02_FULL_45_10]|uniref:Large ribosomal subunit protein bL17 n=1 Tax=Candidatus Magasanikbacteria bacterium RIFCSPHIGHO2_02_FULL_45_10 TaxID=1798679 RepID=A0A1F6MC77_9BACT|nr:MAG: 50S ribosomal protein L17 [Candidatus Magasanikbacteria bacterium RIFCSPHIGHO2_02_FULL_45_10]